MLFKSASVHTVVNDNARPYSTENITGAKIEEISDISMNLPGICKGSEDSTFVNIR